MALTSSNMLALGTQMPAFELPDSVTDKTFSSADLSGSKGSVIMFICNHCPYVIHIQDEIAAVAKEYADKGVRFVAISSNDVANYPADSPEKMKVRAQELGFEFPYLYDETQETARVFEAACTPEFYLFDEKQNCVYRGRFDESSPGNGKPVTGGDLRNAMDLLLAGKTVDEDKQFPSMGCNIKWL